MFDLVRDAARCAAKASHPTDILVTRSGFLVIARNGNLSNSRPVSFSDLEFAPRNQLVDAVREANQAVTINADVTVKAAASDFREG